MRRGATATTRAVAEQATAAEQIAKSSDELTRNIASVSRAMTEQSTAIKQVAASVENMRRQSDQIVRAMTEQSRGLKELTSAANNTSKQVKLITHANAEHSTASSRVLDQLREIRTITARNARGVKETRGNTDELVRQAEALIGDLETRRGRRGASERPTNGRR
jgi:methyl-accepting chemotaxis protein